MSYLYTNIKTIGTYGQHQGYISYSTSQTDDDYTVTISEVGELFSSTSPYSSTYSTSGTSTITASIGSTSRSGSKNGLSANVSSSHSVYLAFNNFNTLTVPITKSNSQQTVTVSISWNWSNIHLTNSVTLTIPAKQSAPVTYTISYNANGGTNAPTAQTYTGSPITITTNKPSRNGYTFVKWDGSVVNIKEDKQVRAITEKKICTVAYVDYVNQKTELAEVYYGDPLVVPVVESVEGMMFEG